MAIVVPGRGVLCAFPGDNAAVTGATGTAAERALRRLRQHAARQAAGWRRHLGPEVDVRVLDTHHPVADKINRAPARRATRAGSQQRRVAMR